MRPEAGERDDAALLRAVARGDEDALAALYDRHAGWLTVRLTRRCALPDVVDHAVQDTFLAVWREAVPTVAVGMWPRSSGALASAV
jgi:DNA-directed RNA polymerase specialized sigma24 family protein